MPYCNKKNAASHVHLGSEKIKTLIPIHNKR